jgi:AraC family transcriptional regulator
MSHDLLRMRDSTLTARRRAIERVVDTMQRRLSEPMTLREMARVALMSPYHFNRMFRAMTRVPPCRFLTALRIEAAKRLLLETDMSVTSICFEVGYESLGSFITRFSQQVGASPRALRRLAGEAAARANRGETDAESGCPGRPERVDESAVRGRIVAAEDHPGLVFFGLFAEDAPHGRPIRCGYRQGPGEFSLSPVPDGQWHLFAVSFPDAINPTEYLLPDMREMFVAEGPVPIRVAGGCCDEWSELILHRAQLTDPPILVALTPFLTREHTQANGPGSWGLAARRHGRAAAQAVSENIY